MNMHYDLVTANYVKDFQIRVEFADGSVGIANLKDIINKGGIFSELQNPEKFKEFFIHKELNVLTWANDIDIAPETLYALAIEEKFSA
jgi:hypothetical protein